MSNERYNLPNTQRRSAEDIHPGAELQGTNLSEAELRDADLSGADLRLTNLSKANLRGANLTDANLREANLSEAKLCGTDFSKADLRQADFYKAEAERSKPHFTEADLHNADIQSAKLLKADFSKANLREVDLNETNVFQSDFSETDLRKAELIETGLREVDLSGADLRDADLTLANLFNADLSGANLINTKLSGGLLVNTPLSGALLSRKTSIDPPNQQLKQDVKYKVIPYSSNSVDIYDAIARANHELKTAYSDNGLISQARKARVRERKARRKEALVDGGFFSRGTAAWLWSIFSQIFTGYGVQLKWIVGVMVLLYLGSAGVYAHFEGMGVNESLYYSIVTFTTSPPRSPSVVGFGPVGAFTAGIETFAGTAAIVFLGYVLGSRESI